MPPATAVYLPPELIEEILHRLPPKSLGLCRCVSKPFNALISSPQFIKTHLARTNLPLEKLILVCNENRSLHSVSFLNPAYPKNDGVLSADATELRLLPPLCHLGSGSVNGLFLLTHFDNSMFLMNPKTGESVQIPSCPLTQEDYQPLCGFGYDSLNDDYKVVLISSFEIDEVEDDNGFPDHDMFVEVYSLSSNSWKKFEKSPIDLAFAEFGSGFYLNGCLHWLCYGYRHIFYTTVGIAGFNLENEEFEVLPLPGCFDDEKSRVVIDTLDVVNGCLCFVIIRDDRLTMDFWVMKEYGVRESWNKYSIYGLNTGIHLLCIDIISFLGDREIVMKVGQRLVVYNVEGKMFTDIVVRGLPPNFDIVATYVESLVSPKCCKEIKGGIERCVPIEDQLYLQLCLQPQQPQAHLQ